MTGFGGYVPGSQETRGLKAIDSNKYSYVNKDFVKNMQRLNQATDYMSAYMQTMQKGIDDANQNAIEQIQSFAADLFVLFAGLEPTGIEIGDLKYVIQGLGALFGISPTTPFPWNLIDAAYHLLSEYIIPLPQFADVIFDAIEAWAEDLGFSESFMDAFTHFRTAIESFFGTLDTFGEKMGELFDALGIIGLDLETFSDTFALIINVIVSIIDNPIVGDLIEFVTSILAPLVDVVAWLIDFVNPANFISGATISDLSTNIVPKPNSITTVWSVGGDANNAWIFDSTQSASGSDGSLKTNGTGTSKRVVTQKINPCKPGQKLVCNAKFRWSGVPSAADDFGMSIVWYQGQTEVGQNFIKIPPGHGATGGFTALPTTEVTVPSTPDIDGFRVGARVDGTVNSGTIWADDLSVQIKGNIPQNFIEGLITTLSTFLNSLSPLNALNLFGLDGLLSFIPLSFLGNAPSGNLLVEPGFDSSDSISIGIGWSWDSFTGRTSVGCAKALAGSTSRELASVPIAVTQGQTLDISAWVKWQGISYTGINPIIVGINRYNGDTYVGTSVVATQASPATNQTTFTEFAGSYTVPSGCNKVRLSFKVGSSVSAGSVWFDDAFLQKTSSGLPQSWIFNLIPDLAGIQDFIQDVIDTIISVIRGIPFVGGFLADLLDDLTDWFDDTQATAADASDALLGVQATQDILVSNITGTPATNVVDADVEDAVAGQTQTIVTTAASIAALQQVQTSNSNSGNSVLEPFEYVNASTLDTGLWSQIYILGTSASTVLAVQDGHNCNVKLVGAGSADIMAKYIGPNPKSLTDYQSVTKIIATSSETPGAFDGRVNWTYVYCRIADNNLSWVRGGVSCTGQVAIQYRNAGGSVTSLVADLPAFSVPNLGPGDNLTIEAGALGILRYYRLFVNGRKIHEGTDGTTLTLVGSTARNWGQGASNDNGLIAGKVTQWGGTDLLPVAIRGSGFRASKTTTTSVAKSTSGDFEIPSGTYNNVETITPDMAWNGQRLTLGYEGWYMFSMKTTILNPRFTNDVWSNFIYVNVGGTPTPMINGDELSDISVGAPIIRYCLAGDVITPGFGSFNSLNITGDTAGRKTWFSAVLLNRSLA